MYECTIFLVNCITISLFSHSSFHYIKSSQLAFRAKRDIMILHFISSNRKLSHVLKIWLHIFFLSSGILSTLLGMSKLVIIEVILVHTLSSSLTGSSSVLSLILEYYSTTFAMREVKSHVLVVVNTHLAALPWHHLHPSLQDTLIFSKVLLSHSSSLLVHAVFNVCNLTSFAPHLVSYWSYIPQDLNLL